MSLFALTLKCGNDIEMSLIPLFSPQEKRMVVYVDTTAVDDVMVRCDSRFTEIRHRLTFFNRGKPLCITLLLLCMRCLSVS